jgi:raffinose/stachyose/melibiose transport system substrate-binding protein
MIHSPKHGRIRRITALAAFTTLVALGVVLAGQAGATSTRKGTTPAAAHHSTAVTVTVWEDLSTYGPKVPAMLNKLTALFEKQNPGIKINRVTIPTDQKLVKVRQAIAAKTGPDVIMLYPGANAGEFKSGLAPLQKFISPALRKQVPQIRDAKSPNGDVLAVPYTSYVYTMYFNRALFAKAGLNPTQPPKTWSAFMNACDKLSAAGITPIASGWKDGIQLEWFIYQLADQLMSKSDQAKWTAFDLPYTSAPFKQSYAYMEQMIAHKCFAKGAEGHTLYNDAYDAFYAGKGAMFLGNGILSEIAPGEKALGKNFDLFAFPRVPDSKRPQLSDAGAFAGWAMTSFSKHQPEAWKYIQFLLSPSAQETAWKVGNLVPNNVMSKVTTTSPGMKKVFQLAKNPNNWTSYYTWTQAAYDTDRKFAPLFLTGGASTSQILGQLERVRLQQRPLLK